MIVVDTNIIGYLFLTSDQSPQAERAMRKDSTWAAPILWRSELRNVLSLYLRKELLTLNDAREIMYTASDMMLGNEYQVKSDRVLELVHLSNCSAYDCEFVALALDLEAPLVTSDHKILKSFPDIAVSLSSYIKTT